MDIFVSLLVAVHVIVCLLLVVIVLMQRPKQEGLGAAFGGGMTDQMFGAQTTDVLQKGTVWLSVAFFVITMTLAILISKRSGEGSLIDESLTTSDVVPIETTDGLPLLPEAEEMLTTGPAGAAADTPAEDGEKPVTEEPAGDAEAKASDDAPDAGAEAKSTAAEAAKEAVPAAAETDGDPAEPAKPAGAAAE